MFSSPLGVPIHPRGHFGQHGELRPAGNHEPEVTATFADHIAGKRNPGVDIGTGRCGDPLYAMGGGVISLAGLVGYPKPNALTVRIRVGDYEPAVTHMGSIAVNPRTKAKWKVGDVVNRGEAIGTLGSTGASACHLHMGMKQLINGAWVEIDGWPLLDQNQQEDAPDMPPLKTYAPALISLGGSPLINGAVGLYDAPSTTRPPVYRLEPGKGFLTVIGTVGKGGDEWYVYWDVATGKWLYVNLTNVPIRKPLEDASAAREAGLDDARAALAQLK